MLNKVSGLKGQLVKDPSKQHFVPSRKEDSSLHFVPFRMTMTFFCHPERSEGSDKTKIRLFISAKGGSSE